MRKPIYFFLLFFVVCSTIILFNHYVIGNWDWYTKHKINKLYSDRKNLLDRLIHDCDLVVQDYPNQKMTISYHSNQNALVGYLNDSNRTISLNLTNKYQDIYNEMADLGMNYINVDKCYAFSLSDLPDDVNFVYFPNNCLENKDFILRKSKWYIRLNSNFYALRASS